MGDFELLDRDGLSRLGRLSTPHGPIDTPALLPVVHPDPLRQPVAPKELRRRFGLTAVITSAYITWRTPPLRELAESKGIHGLLDFDGPVMTDSGAFQQHAYGHVEVTADEIHAFQRRIGTDILTVLDEFTEPDASPLVAEAAVDATAERARLARELQRGLLAVPVQGGRYPGLRLKSAAAASEIGDVLAVGGVVPLLEQYRYAALARVVLGARPGLAPERPVHLFGAGHPMVFAFAALFGIDLFDSSAYLKFARRGDLMFPEGTVPIDSLREARCACALCAEMPLTEVARLPPPQRELRIAAHNLRESATEVAVVRQAIRDGELWELAERRAAAHPALIAGLRAAVRGGRVFLPSEPESRRSFRFVSATSGLRPAAIGFLARLRQYTASRGPFHDHPRVPLVPSALRETPTEDRSGLPVHWQAATPFGPVPLELTELYPVGCAVSFEEFDAEPGPEVHPAGDRFLDLGEIEVDRARDWAPEWDRRQAQAILTWRYAGEVGDTLLRESEIDFLRSRRSGRLRAIRRAGHPLFIVGPDGLPRPTWRGAEWLQPLLPAPRSRVVVAPDAVEFVRSGRSLFSRFAETPDPFLSPGSSALLVDRGDRLLAVGRLLLAPFEMGRFQRGVAVRVTAHQKGPAAEENLEEEAAQLPR